MSGPGKMSTQRSEALSVPEALRRAHAHWNAGQADQAEILCQRVLAVWPGQADALHLLGLTAHAYGDLDLAISRLREACKATRVPAVYLSNFAEMCRQKGLYAEGEAAGRRAVALNPSLPGAWNNLGIILQETGRFEESRVCLERVLALAPDNPEAHNNLGNSCKRLGLMDEAERHWRAALALRPDYAEPHSNLANILVDQGAFDRAIEHAERALVLNPQLADAYLNLAAAEIARHRPAEALRRLNALLGFAPLHAGGLAALARTFKQVDRLDEALDAARRAVASAPQSAEAHNVRGQVLQATGRFDEALAAFDHAAALPGTEAERALVNRAILFMEHGKTAEAETAFAAALTAFPRSATAWFNRSDLVRYRAGDPAIAAMEALLAPGGLQAGNDRMTLHFALGKAYLDIGDSAGAFAHFDQGNRMERARITYDAEATSRWMASIAETFDAGLMARLGGQGAGSARPVFVLGMPRSGTTLVEQILASHPDIHGAGELCHIRQLAGDFPAMAGTIAPAQLAALGDAYLAAIAPLGDGKRHVVDKMPANFFYAGLIHLILPEARIIHCRRDPVDTCLSCYTKLFSGEQAFSYDQNELGHFHRDYQKLVAHWRALLPPDRFLEVEYEAVVADLEGEARRMIDYLGLAWDPACLAFHETNRAVRTASMNQVRQPLYRTATGRWRQHAAQLQPLLEALGVSPA